MYITSYDTKQPLLFVLPNTTMAQKAYLGIKKGSSGIPPPSLMDKMSQKGHFFISDEAIRLQKIEVLRLW